MSTYDDLPVSTREKLESDFRNLLRCIPTWRRNELENDVYNEGANDLLEKWTQYQEHWGNAKVVSVDSQISGWKDYVDPITGEINESERF